MSNKKTEIAIKNDATDIEVKNDATDIAAEESKRGRRPLTHAEMSGRLTTPLPHDSQAGHFILDTFGSVVFGELSDENKAIAYAGMTAGYMLGRNTTVRAWYRESAYAQIADEMTEELRIAEEARAASAKGEAAGSKLANESAETKLAAMIAMGIDEQAARLALGI